MEQRPTAQDWLDRKEPIIKLYLQERMPLIEVMKVMNEKHGFNARYDALRHLLFDFHAVTKRMQH